MTVSKRILIDLDPRADTQPALERIIRFAPEIEVELFVCENLDYASGGALYDDAKLQQSRDEYMSNIESWLDERARALEESGFTVKTRIAWHTPRFEAILDEAKRYGANLIMRSAKQHSKLERLLVSATDWELVRQAPQIVWLVKNQPQNAPAAANVLAAVDPAHAAEKKVGLDRAVMQVAAEIASVHDSDLHMFHAWQPGAAIAPAVAAGPHVPMPVVRVDAELIEGMRKERRDLLVELATPHDVPEQRMHVREGAVLPELDKLISKHDIGVVVAGGVSRGRLERLIVGSTAEDILESVDCDVVVVKPPSIGDPNAHSK